MDHAQSDSGVTEVGEATCSSLQIAPSLAEWGAQRPFLRTFADCLQCKVYYGEIHVQVGSTSTPLK